MPATHPPTQRPRQYRGELQPAGPLVPPVQLPVSGRTLGRHVSLGPGWEQNKEDTPPPYPSVGADEPSTSAAAAEAALPEVWQGCPELPVVAVGSSAEASRRALLCS